MAAGAVGFAGFASTPTANATCASFFGIGNSANCTSTLTSVAIAIGENAQAHAGGVLGAAFSLGASSSATTAGTWNFALTNGTNSSTYAGGVASTAIGWSVNDATVSAGNGSGNNVWNAAVVLGARSNESTNVAVNGILNVGVGFLSSGDIDADGTGTVTVNSLGGLNNLTNHGNFSNVSSFLSGATTITNTGSLSWAWDVVGATNTVETSGGLNVAGAFSQENETVVQNGPGVNVKIRPTVGSSARVKAQPAAVAKGAGAGTDQSGATSGDNKRTSGHGAKGRNRG
jgi:hypothetical protein